MPDLLVSADKLKRYCDVFDSWLVRSADMFEVDEPDQLGPFLIQVFGKDVSMNRI